MAKKVDIVIKLQIPAGGANPAPPVGPALGQHGLNIMDFCKAFNEKTKNREPGILVPVDITVYKNKSFSFKTKIAPVSALIKKAVGIAVASGEPNKIKIGEITEKEIEQIAEKKMPDLNTDNIEAAKNIVKGTAKSMGVVVVAEATGKEYDTYKSPSADTVETTVTEDGAETKQEVAQ